jgi:hypothetical protein
MKVKFKQVSNCYMYRSPLGLKVELKPGIKKWDLFIDGVFKDSAEKLRDLKVIATNLVNAV